MKTALIFGSSGLIGGHLLDLIINDNNYNKIKLFVRSEPTKSNSKLEIIKINFNNLEKYKDLITGDDCFFCIGTTRKQTPNKQDYIDIELNLPIKIAKITKKNNIKSFIYISSGGANSKSKNLYLQNKGKAEENIINLEFDFTAIIQPSLLLGSRVQYRIGEMIAQFVFKNLSFIFVGKLKPFKAINAENVAKAIIRIIRDNKKNIYFSSDYLEDLSKI
mgnify:CR=1 FL=1